MDNNIERWYSMKEIMEYLGVSVIPFLTGSSAEKCPPPRSAGFGNSKSAKLMPG